MAVNSELFYYEILSKHFFKKKNIKEGRGGGRRGGE